MLILLSIISVAQEPYLIFFLNHILLYQFTYPQRRNDSLESYLWELSEVVSLDRMSLHVHQILYRLEFFLQWPSCMPEPKSNKQLSPLPNNASLLTLWGTSCNNEIQYKHFNFPLKYFLCLNTYDLVLQDIYSQAHPVAWQAAIAPLTRNKRK